jgi:hypothetical protein
VTYRSNTVNVPLLNHRWEPELGVGRGKAVNIPGFTQNNAARNRGAGTGTFGTGATITFDAATETETTLTVNRFYYKADRMPVEMEPQAHATYAMHLTEGRGQAVALQVDEDIADDTSAGFDAFTTIVGVDNVDLTDDDLLTIQTNLDNQNTEKGGPDRYFVMSPATRASLMKIEAVRNQMYASSIGNLDGSKGAGYIGDVLSLKCYMSNNLASGTSGKKNAAFHREAIAFAEQIGLRTMEDDNIEDGVFRQHITFNTCGFVIVKNAFGVEVASK